MKKSGGIASLFVVAALIVILGFTTLVGFGSRNTGAMENIKLGLDLAGGVSIMTGANLPGAKLPGAKLPGAHLSWANLLRTNLSGANLSEANLTGADLSEANLFGANLSKANLTGANLSEANLSGAHLFGANLTGADLSGANLFEANLSGANLFAANLSEALNIDTLSWDSNTAFYPLQCPQTGTYTAYKKANNLIVELEIPYDALRSSATSRKCRASKARVISITDLAGRPAGDRVLSDYAHSPKIEYIVGQTIEIPNFDTNRWHECAPGIHHYITREEAVKHEN